MENVLSGSCNSPYDILEKAHSAYRAKEFNRAGKLLKPLLQSPNQDAETLRLAYQTFKSLGRYRDASRILKRLEPLLNSEEQTWLKQEKKLCRRKIRHSNSDTFLFFGVCFSSFYVTARYGMQYRNEYFLVAGLIFFLIGFSLRRFYVFDK